MAQYKTPTIINLRDNGATFYTFASAVEDIGLNISERQGKVCLTHYVLLNLPAINIEGIKEGCINVHNIIDGCAGTPSFDLGEGGTDNTRILPNMLQNYALNFETRIRNNGQYDFSDSTTVSERVFWKWLQKTGAIKFDSTTTIQRDEPVTYYHENFENPQDAVIKGFGQITTSSQTSNSFNMNNETYIMVPSSYGQMRYYLRHRLDNNYRATVYKGVDSELLEGFKTRPDDKFYPYFDITEGITNYGGYEVRKPTEDHPEYATDALEFEFDIKDIRDCVREDLGITPEDERYDKLQRMTYDDLAILPEFSQGNTFDFNAMLVYYTIYDTAGNKIATNAFGLMIMHSVNYDSENNALVIPSLSKKASSGKSFGSSYAMRINIQTSSIMDTSSEIVDYSTADAPTLETLGEAISNFKSAVDTLKINAVVLAKMYNDNQAEKVLVLDTVNKVNELEKNVTDLMHGNVRTVSAKTVNTLHLDTSTLANSLRIVNPNGEIVGYIDGSTLYMPKLQTEDFELDTIKTKVIDASDGLVITHKNGNAMKIDTGGNILFDNANSKYGDLLDSLSNTEGIGQITLNEAKQILDAFSVEKVGTTENPKIKMALSRDPSVLEPFEKWRSDFIENVDSEEYVRLNSLIAIMTRITKNIPNDMDEVLDALTRNISTMQTTIQSQQSEIATLKNDVRLLKRYIEMGRGITK